MASGKFTAGILILSFLLLMGHFSGLISNSPNASLLYILLNWDSIHTTSIFVIITAALAAATIIGATIGLIFPQKNESFILAPVAAALLILVEWDIISLALHVRESLAIGLESQVAGTMISTLLFAPFALLTIFIVVEWWRGRD